MTGSVHVVWDDELLRYDPGEGHPMRPVRLAVTMALAKELGVLDRDPVTLIPAEVVAPDLLTRVHTEDYVAAVRRAVPSERYGLGTMDDPVWDGMHEASARVAGASVAAAQAIRSGRALHAVNIAGGLHHAHRSRAAGFCVYNDPAIAIRALLDDGVRRIAYVDVDAHHGDGVQEAFYDDDRVLTISLHQSGTTLFPGTGFPTELGNGDAEGTSVNVALPGFTGDAGWLRAFSGVVPVLLRAFEPEILVTQCGCDSHRVDPLTDLQLTVDGQRASYLALHDLAHEICDGRWLALGGGGYALADAVPRAWSHLLAVASGEPLDPSASTPQPWRRSVRDLFGVLGPERMTDRDGKEPSYEPWDAGVGDSDD